MSRIAHFCHASFASLHALERLDEVGRTRVEMVEPEALEDVVAHGVPLRLADVSK
jgi:hypothetical protein